ncbi:alpha/beta hydrolase [soil metagenome]
MNITSADGTTLAATVAGTGAVIVIVDPAMATQKESRKLAGLLGDRFTTVTYDRRGRGGSTDASSGTAEPEREIEDIEAVIAATGGRAVLFGSSSGAAVALAAATALGDKVTGVVLYEPPFIVDGSRAPIDPGLPGRIAELVSSGDRSGAAKAFFTEAVGVPGFGVAIMRLLPMWRDAKAIVPTVRYDFAALDGTQTGRPLPAGRWSAMTAPGIVMVGSKSEPFFHAGAKALADAVASISYESLDGGHHGSPQMSPAVIAERIIAEFG